MQAFGFDESNAAKAIPLPPPDGLPPAGKEALVPSDSQGRERRGGHRPKPAAISSAPNLMAMVNALRRRWQLALTLGILLGLLAAGGTWLLRPVSFMARTQLRVLSVQPRVLGGALEAPSDFNNYARNQMALIRTRPVLNTALRDEKVSNLPIIREQLDPIDYLEKNIRVDFPAPEIMRIFMNGQKDKDMVLIVDAVCDAYLMEIVYKENESKQRRINKLREIWTDHDSILRGKRNTLKEMAKQVGGGGVKEGAVIKLDFREKYVNMLENMMLERRKALSTAMLELETVLAAQKTVGKLTIPPETLNTLLKKDMIIERDQKKLAKLEEMVDDFKAHLQVPEQDSGYQKALMALTAQRKALEGRMAKLRPELEQHLQKINSENIAAETEKYKARVTFLTKAEKTLKAEIDKNVENNKIKAGEAVDLKWLEDEILGEEALVKELAKQKQNLDVEMQAPHRVTKYEPGIAIPTTTEAGRIGFATMAGFGTLFAVIFGIAFLEFKARRVSHIDEVTQGLKIHLMGSLPNVPKRALAGSTAPRDLYWQNRLTESVDAIRTTLMNAARFEGLRVVMVTSAVGGEGKTLLACHLAASLARAGLNTLLIDGDLRRPAVHRLFGLELPRGLSDLLRGELTAADVTHTGLVDGLSVITAGQRDIRASQALAGPSIRDVLDKLRGSYDFIVVDSAPVLPVADSQLIGQHTDGVVFSIMRDVSRLPQVYAAYERLSVLRIRTLGAVVNGISGGSYGAGDYYYIASTPAAETAAPAT